ncbi:MAG: hypothetical protein NTV88_01985 [Candidatus Micrarchaeota archaeon]|nr:hypothetical protein [Candidatus Micrarchaeota archaeon]
MMVKKGQAALDFLMTYGWALLIIALAAAAIVALGILDMGSFIGSRATGFSQIEPIGWSLDHTGVFNIKLKNNAGTDINVTSVTTSYNSVAGNCSALNPPVGISLPEGSESGVINACTFGAINPGASYSLRLNINYTDSETGFSYTDAGTVTGKVL